jgi:general secretion pathway protein G
MNKERGITLIELMIVVVIMGLIASIVAVKIFPHRKEETRVRAAKTEMDTISISLEMYRSTIGHFPSTDQGLPALVKKPSPAAGENLDAWNGPYIRLRRFTTTPGGCGCHRRVSAYPIDPWGNEYVYGNMDDSNGRSVANEVGEEIIPGACLLVCRGADGEIGGTGWDEDIVVVCIK